MKVLKFGGTSVGRPERMRQVLDYYLSGKRKKDCGIISDGRNNK